MIKYALICEACEHEFEAWFASSTAYDSLADKHMLTCPDCGDARVTKALMAPSVRPSRGRSSDPDAARFADEFAEKARKHVAENFDYVGGGFAEEARAMYYGETEDRPIWGETTPEESKALAEEGVPAAPLPKAFTPKPPKQAVSGKTAKKLN